MNDCGLAVIFTMGKAGEASRGPALIFECHPIELRRMLDRIGAPPKNESLDTAFLGAPYELVQLELEAHRQAVRHDPFRQPGGVQAPPDGAE